MTVPVARSSRLVARRERFAVAAVAVQDPSVAVRTAAGSRAASAAAVRRVVRRPVSQLAMQFAVTKPNRYKSVKQLSNREM